ncbi:hypothetical protein Ga0074812_15230 [Parafrankia irregularis]|uniref:Uncharacterized protein n=1 Tax=Parafrankia irregularis TaxID=795642 RepID=A0A0S4QZM7_9ACTN|nr:MULTISPECIES: hypothetical protein [Parafrankia]MBE3206694.1 hypothetical protein [Parafrankia sp. CH37]CUU61005.1 hypothetical protein Ga0074812_15230 [Parafrankia irregularis]
MADSTAGETSPVAQDDPAATAWNAETERLYGQLTELKRLYVAAQLGLVGHLIRTFESTDTNGLAMSTAEATKVEITVRSGDADYDPSVTLNAVLAADGSEIASWVDRPGVADLTGLDELVCGPLEACIANGMQVPSGGEVELPPPGLPDPAMPPGDDPAIPALWERIKKIEEREGYWNGGDVASALMEWFAELGYRVDEPEAR